MPFRPLVIVGPSGAGKGTLINSLTEKHQNRFGFSVSYATRKPREGEEHGKHYFFVSVDEFKKMIEKDEFIEYCEVHGNYYGTSKQVIKDIQEREQIPLLDIDVQGALKFNKVFHESNFLVVLPPDVDSLKDRLEKRGTETPESLKKRIGNATDEMKMLVNLDEIFNYRIVNSDLDTSKFVMSKLVEGLYLEELKMPAKNIKFWYSYLHK
jgi:guanylate kinase